MIGKLPILIILATVLSYSAKASASCMEVESNATAVMQHVLTAIEARSLSDIAVAADELKMLGSALYISTGSCVCTYTDNSSGMIFVLARKASRQKNASMARDYFEKAARVAVDTLELAARCR